MNKPTIYCIDDQKTALLLYENHLSDEYDICSFRDAQDALDHIEGCKPVAVICDLSMPWGKDGWWFTDKLKAIDATIPVIIATAHNEEHFRLLALQKGQAFWYKGEKYDILKEQLRCLTKLP